MTWNKSLKPNISMGNRLYNFLQKRFSETKSHSAMSKELGFPNSTVITWEKGTPIPSDALLRLKELGCNIDWLLTGMGDMTEAESDGALVSQPEKQEESRPIIQFSQTKDIPAPKGRRITRPKREMATRGLAAADDSGGSRVPDTDDFGDSLILPDGLIGVPVFGDSMSPVILSGQYAEIDIEREGFEEDDGIYVVSVLEPSDPDDDRTEPITGTFIKRVQREEDTYYLKSINTYSPFSVYTDHCRIWPVLGVWFAGKGKPPEGF